MASTVLESLGRVIRRLREKTGVSQERFAFDIGVHRTYMGHLERGSANPTVKTLQLVAAGLGVTIGELLTLAESEATERVTPLRRVAEPGGRRPAARRRK